MSSHGRWTVIWCRYIPRSSILVPLVLVFVRRTSRPSINVSFESASGPDHLRHCDFDVWRRDVDFWSVDMNVDVRRIDRHVRRVDVDPHFWLLVVDRDGRWCDIDFDV